MHRDRIKSFALGPSISEDEARAGLERVLGDSEFHSTDRNKKFLRFVSEELFQGRSEAAKAYSVAVDVIGRPPTFDRFDCADRGNGLRASLARYYERHGRSGGIDVELPKGRYVPVFGRLETDGSGSTQPLPSPALPVAGACPEETEKEPKLQTGPRRKRAVIALTAAGLALLGAASLADVFGGAGAEIVADKPRVLVEAGSADDTFDEYRRGRFDAVLRCLQQLGTPAGFEATILGAAALAELGRAEDAWNMRMAHPRSLRAAMAARSFAPELIGMIETGLAKAGIGID